jgi:hypothetical protein
MLYQEKSGNPGAERRSYQLDGIWIVHVETRSD